MYRDPMLRAERSIHRALDEAMFMSLRQRTREEDRRAQGLDEIIAAEQVVTLYQPILDLRTLRRARPRGLQPRPGGRPLRGGGAPVRAGRAHRAPGGAGAALPPPRPGLGARATCKPGTKLFLNTSARALRDAGGGGRRRSCARWRRRACGTADVVLEITERVAARGAPALPATSCAT